MQKSLAVAALMFAGAVHAEWIERASSDEKTLFVDYDTINIVRGNPRLWFMFEFSSTNTNGSKSQKTLYEADCIEGRLRVLSGRSYSGSKGEGKVISSLDSPSSWVYPVPGTFHELVSKDLCDFWHIDKKIENIPKPGPSTGNR